MQNFSCGTHLLPTLFIIKILKWLLFGTFFNSIYTLYDPTFRGIYDIYETCQTIIEKY